MGATVGVAAIGAIVNHGLPHGAGATGNELAVVHRLSPHGRLLLADAIHPAFLAAAGVAFAVWVVAVIWVKEQPLRRSLDDVEAVDAAAGTPVTAAVDSPR
jgi:hypothetical protein